MNEEEQARAVGTIGLSDCGKTVKMHHTNLDYDFSAEIQMIIKTPRGTLVLYEKPNAKVYSKLREKGRAIKAFVEAYKND